MSRRQSTNRKSKVCAVSETDPNECRSTNRRSNRISRRLTTDSPHKSPIRSANQSPNTAKELPNLSQYFPSRKRSLSSPRNTSSVDSKYTRIKSPNERFRKRLLSENPITYEEFDNNFEELSETPKKSEIKSTVSEDKKVSIDFKGLLNTFKSVMQEVAEEDSEVTADENRNIQNHNNLNQEFDDSIDSLSQMVSDLGTEHKPEKEVNHYLNPIPCHSRDIQSNQVLNQKIIPKKETQKSIPKPQELMSGNDIHMKVELKSWDSNQNQDNSFEDDFDDSFDEMLCEMEFPIEDNNKSIDNSFGEELNIDNIIDNEINDEEDDGFESDGDFERILSQIPNEELAKSDLDKSDSALDTSIRNLSTCSMSSSGLITLSQIIDLINQD